MTQFMLRDGRTINASVSLEPEHFYSYSRNDGTTVYCLKIIAPQTEVNLRSVARATPYNSEIQVLRNKTNR
jgi:hypothetical protein